MTSVYRYEIGTNVYEEGVTVFHVKGRAVEVDGRRMVELAHGVIVPDKGWREDDTAARMAAAEQIERMGVRLIGQAARMRMERDETATAPLGAA